MLENVLVVLIVIVLLATKKRLGLSTISYILIVVFLILHEIGAHYTYSLVPYDEWFKSIFGFSLDQFFGWERNHFDRFVHFLFGVLWVYPIYEFYTKNVSISSGWRWFFAVQSVATASLVFEFIEWAAAAYFGGELGMHYLGTQGDEWDAHKDMLLAVIGALVVSLICYTRGKKFV